MTIRSWILPGAIGVVVLIVGLGVGWALRCPCNQLPGLVVRGEPQNAPVADWGFANQAGLCALQVQGWRSHAVALNCMSANGQLFISCARCAGKYWSTTALANPAGFIRISGNVYPVSITRVTDAPGRALAWNARAAKVRRPPSPPPDHWWTFQLVSRAPP